MYTHVNLADAAHHRSGRAWVVASNSISPKLDSHPGSRYRHSMRPQHASNAAHASLGDAQWTVMGEPCTLSLQATHDGLLPAGFENMEICRIHDKRWENGGNRTCLIAFHDGYRSQRLSLAPLI
ncbi:MAG TPA: hypothetical protein VII39_03100 [Bradyrhizobium sp.]